MNALARANCPVRIPLDHEPLGLESGGAAREPEVDHYFYPSWAVTTPPRVRHLPTETEPGCPPWRSPLGADLKWLSVVGGRAGCHGECGALSVDQRQHAPPEFAFDSPFGELAIVVHASTVSQRGRSVTD